MATTSFRILQRRSSTSGVSPELSTLCSGELFIQLADETIYFRNDKNELVCTLTDKNLGNLCNIFAPTGNYVTVGQTGNFITTLMTGAFGGTSSVDLTNYVTTSQTGSFVTTSQTGVFALSADTGNFVTTSETGVFALSANTGNFVTTSQTGVFALSANTGNFVTTSQTGVFALSANTGNFVAIVDGHIPAQYLPSYVDDIQEFDTTGHLYAHSGEKGHIYLVSGCNSFWRWGGHQYVEIFGSPGSSDGLVEGLTNLYFTAARSAGYVTTGSTGSFVTTSQTGVFALSANTGSFVTTLQTGVFALSVNTGNFVNTGRIGNLAIGGSDHSITGTNNVIYGGYLNSIVGTGVGTINCNNAILAGTGNCINFGYESAIIGGRVNLITGSSFHGNAIIGGLNNVIRSGYLGIITSSESSCIEESNAASIIGGRSNRIFCGNCSSIIGGCSNQLNSTRSSIILGGSGIVGTASDTVYVQNLCVARGIIYGNGLGITGMSTGCFVTTSQTGVYETTGYARNCFVNTGQTGVYETTGYARNCYVTTGQTGSFGGGNGGLSTGSGYLQTNSIFQSFKVCNTGASGIINYDIVDYSNMIFACNSTAHFCLNFRGNSTCTLNQLMPTNNSVTVSFTHTNGIAAYYLSGIYVDNVLQSVNWPITGTGQSIASEIPSGASSSLNLYSLSILKTGNSLYRIFGSMGAWK
jgi:hypothetical protein